VKRMVLRHSFHQRDVGEKRYDWTRFAALADEFGYSIRVTGGVEYTHEINCSPIDFWALVDLSQNNKAETSERSGDSSPAPCSACSGYGYFSWQGKYKERCRECDGTGMPNKEMNDEDPHDQDHKRSRCISNCSTGHQQDIQPMLCREGRLSKEKPER
jgi:hypothetical protein